MNAEGLHLEKDIYYQKEYAELYAGENGSLFSFEYHEDTSRLINYAIKRPIIRVGSVSCNDGCYDLETPYGYGGFYTNDNDPGFVARALGEYRKRCQEERIIAEFVRFHPFNSFPVKFGKLFDKCIHDRNVVVIDLKGSRAERWDKYSGSTRNILRKCARSQSFSAAGNIDGFLEMYGETMKRNQADDFYYFDNEYFGDLLNLSGIRLCEVRHEDTCIAMSIFMCGSDIAHYHLSANSAEHMRLNANYYILDNAFEAAKKWGAKYFLLGGGRTNDPVDSLLKFKQKFSRETKPFYIAGMIHNNEKYAEYVQHWEDQNPDKRDVKFFLKYRLPGQ